MNLRGPYKTKTRREMTTKQLAREFILRRAEPQFAELAAMFPDYTEAELNEVWLKVNEAIVKVYWYGETKSLLQTSDSVEESLL